MTALFTRKPGNDPVPMSRFEILGRVRGELYARLGRQEYIVDALTSDTPDAWAEHDGALIVTVPHTITDPANGREHEMGHRYRHAVPVPVGTFASASKRRGMQVKPNRPVDALDLEPLRGTPPYVAPAAGSAAAAALRPVGGYSTGSARSRGPAAILERLSSKGIDVRLYDGRLLVQTRGGHLADDYARVIERAEGLLIAYLSGQPARCELHHDEGPEAVTVLLGGLFACEAHASSELEP